MIDSEIESQRVVGDIILVLRLGTPEERESMLRTISYIRQDPEYAEQLDKEYPIEL